MKPAPRIRLRTLFLLFFCAAIGLSTYPNLLGALEPAVQTAIIVGLMQQIRRFVLWNPSELRAVTAFWFARLFAILWRAVVAITLAGCMLRTMLLARGVVTPSDRESILIIQPLSDGLPQLCMLIVVCNSLMRWRAQAFDAKQRPANVTLLWILGILMALTMLLEGTMIDFLVHRAVAGIEAAQPQQLHRPGVYIRLDSEGYKALWFGLGANICLIAAGTIAAHWPEHWSNRGWSITRWVAVLLLLFIPGLYCYSYYGQELYRLSPDMAEAGLALTTTDLVAGIELAIIAIAAGAYRFGRIREMGIAMATDIGKDIEQKAFHESLPGLVLLAGNACYFLAIEVMEFVNYERIGGTPTLFRYVSMLCYPTSLLRIAIAVASLQFCYIRWRNRSRIIPEELTALSPKGFLEGGVMLACVVAIGIPTLRAFAFTLWLGPYNLLQIFGY